MYESRAHTQNHSYLFSNLSRGAIPSIAKKEILLFVTSNNTKRKRPHTATERNKLHFHSRGLEKVPTRESTHAHSTSRANSRRSIVLSVAGGTAGGSSSAVAITHLDNMDQTYISYERSDFTSITNLSFSGELVALIIATPPWSSTRNSLFTCCKQKRVRFILIAIVVTVACPRYHAIHACHIGPTAIINGLDARTMLNKQVVLYTMPGSE